jgi:hypothetical protein
MSKWLILAAVFLAGVITSAWIRQYLTFLPSV